jgi:hypothetical protein
MVTSGPRPLSASTPRLISFFMPMLLPRAGKGSRSGTAYPRSSCRKARQGEAGRRPTTTRKRLGCLLAQGEQPVGSGLLRRRCMFSTPTLAYQGRNLSLPAYDLGAEYCY